MKLNHIVIKCLTRMRLIHGGPARILEAEPDLYFFSIACYKCKSEQDLMWDEAVRPALWAILCDEPWELVDPYCTGKNIWHWNGETEWYTCAG